MKINFTIFCFFLITKSLFAQETGALRQDESRKPEKKYLNKNLSSSSDTISLPLFDEFSKSDKIPNSNFWMPNGGTYVNNRFCIEPPSFNVVSFDGLNENGQPYSEADQFADGKCDELVSKPLNLESKTDVYLSFYWQAQGMAVPQIIDDSLHLMFLDTAGNWNQIWYQKGQELNDFQFSIIKVEDEYLHKGFQFKFESFGNQSGMYGVWHLDYIYLNDGRNPNDSTLNDVAFSTAPSYFLKEYRAMPVWQFFSNPTTHIQNTLSTALNNFKNDGTSPFYILETFGDLIDSTSGNVLNFHANPTFTIGPSQKQKAIFGSNSDLSFINSQNDFTTIETRFYADTKDQNIGDTVNGKVAAFSTKVNDTISSFSTLSDFYAYDDGSAEQTFRITTDNAFVMQEFTLNRIDTIYGVSVYFPGNPFDYDSTQIVWYVWDKVEGQFNSDDINYSERSLISIAKNLNGFVNYYFSEIVTVNDKFYLGYKQEISGNSGKEIFIGFDVNNREIEPVYYNKDGEWRKYYGPGVLMIRALMAPNPDATGLKKMEETSSIRIFPNPAKDVVNLSENVEFCIVKDLSGKMMGIFQNTNNIDIKHLTQGLYLLEIIHNDKHTVKKLIKNN